MVAKNSKLQQRLQQAYNLIQKYSTTPTTVPGNNEPVVTKDANGRIQGGVTQEQERTSPAQLGNAVPEFTPKDPNPILNGLTPEDKARAIAAIEAENRAIANANATPTTESTGFGIAGSRDRTREQARTESGRQAAKDFLISQGMTAEQASAEVAKYTAKGDKKKVINIPGFKNWLQENGYKYDLTYNKKTGKFGFTGNTTVGANLEDPNAEIDTLRDTGTKSALGITNDLMPLLGEDLKGATEFKTALRQRLLDELGSTSPDGLTADQENILANQRAYLQSRGNQAFNQNVGSVFDRMRNRGALNSSLIGQNLKRGALDAYGDFQTNMESTLGKQADDFRNSAAQRTAQRVGSINAAFGSAGGGSLYSLYNPYLNPGTTGNLTDDQRINAVNNLRNSDLANRQTSASRAADGYLAGTIQPMSDEIGGGGGSGIGSTIGGVAGTVLGNAILPGVGGTIGGALGGYVGGKF